MRGRICGILLVLSYIVLAVNCHRKGHHDDNPHVHAPIGPIRGSIMKTRLGKDIAAFRGVRYAEAPVGDNRFRQAIPVAGWNHSFDASKEGPACILPGVPDMSEDCLRLNVYTTKLPTALENPKRPVIVFFHPGGFYGFSGQSYVFGPQYLLDKDIVLVTVNYRLSTLGFISTGDSYAPGNLGLKDQVVALRWVKRNIAAFGGDPNCVTITGHSAGSWSVDLHMMSPMSRGLFHRIIALSGSPAIQEPLPTQQRHLAVKQAELLGCPTGSSKEIVQCLKTKPASNFSDTVSKFFEWHGDPILVWSPVVEPEVPGVERFLPGQPADLIRQGKFQQVPIMTGITKDEFGGVVVLGVNLTKSGNDSVFQDMNDNWDTIAPISFLYERNTERSKRISHELRKFYFPGGVINENTLDGLAHIYADSVTIFGVHRFVKLVGAASSAPLYFYKFSYPGRYSYYMWNSTTPYGVCHHDDLFYLFYLSFRVPFFEVGAPETKTVDRMTAIWENFAKTGQPIPSNNPDFENVQWDRYSPDKDNYMEISNDFQMKQGLYTDRMNEWDRLFPLPPVPPTANRKA